VDASDVSTRCDLHATARGTRKYPQNPITQTNVKTLIHGKPHKEMHQENNYSRFTLNTDDPKHLEEHVAMYSGRAGKTSWQERPNRSTAFVDTEWSSPCRGGGQTHAPTGDSRHVVKPRGSQERPIGKKVDVYSSANNPDEELKKAKFLDCAGVASWGFDVPRSAPKQNTAAARSTKLVSSGRSRQARRH